MTENDPKNCDHAPSASPCRLEVSEHEVHNASKLPEVLKRVFGDATVAGIAWATNGTWSVLEIGDATLEVSSPKGFDLSRVYEARVWQVITDKEASATLAHEFRWVNGLGSCELTLTGRPAKAAERAVGAAPEAGSLSPYGLAHTVTYMQHDPRRGPLAEDTTPAPMSAIEYITEETKYGNMAVTDQLFTGEWS